MAVSDLVLDKWEQDAQYIIDELQDWDNTYEYTEERRQSNERILLLIQQIKEHDVA